jgi:hypothetical protein
MFRGVRVVAAFAATWGAALCGSDVQAAAACDRACLDGFVDRYFDALVAHDPKRLALTPNVKFTENGQPLKLGDALWHNVTGAPTFKLHFNDVEQGQAGAFAVLPEAGNPVIMYLRLRIEGGNISEIETIVNRSDPAFHKPQDMKVKPTFLEALPPERRRSRAEMIKTLNAYLQAIVTAKPNDAIFHPDCQRVENGVVTASNPDGDKMGKLSCGAQLHTGVSALLTGYREPRYFVVDEERGLVGVIFFFDHSGAVTQVALNFPDGSTGERKSSAAPFSWMAGELFKLDDGKIRRIEIVITRVPYGMRSGWSAAASGAAR